MIKKDELLSFFKKGLNAEEKGILIYTKHLANVMFLSGLTDKEQEKIKEVLLTLRKDSERHKVIFQGLINKIAESGRDVF